MLWFVGGIVALFVTGIPLSVSAAIGFIALFGQAVLNGVVMVSYFNQLKAQGLSAFDAVRRGAMVRLRAVLMTALLAMLGLLPMALSTDIGSETQRPRTAVDCPASERDAGSETGPAFGGLPLFVTRRRLA